MDRYDIRVSEQAASDLESVYNYIAYYLYSPGVARRQYDRIADAISSLDVFPKRFPLFTEEPEHSYGIRKMLVDNYLVCYIVEQHVVFILAVLYSSSNIHERLNRRS